MAHQGPTPTAPNQEASPTNGLSKGKACQILQDGKVNGTPLSDSQRRLMGAVCSGQKPQRAEHGAIVMPVGFNSLILDVVTEDPEWLRQLPKE